MIYRDIDFSLRRLSSGDINVKTNENAVAQMLEVLLLTQKGERVFDKDFGTDIVDYLYESANILNAMTIKDKIYTAIKNYMTNVIIEENDISMIVNTKTNAYEIYISYSENEEQEKTNISLTLKVFR